MMTKTELENLKDDLLQNGHRNRRYLLSVVETALSALERVEELEGSLAKSEALSAERWDYIQGKNMEKRRPFFEDDTK